MDYIVRLHLKTSCEDRRDLISFCLNSDKQCLAIGWSYVHENEKGLSRYEEYYYAVKKGVKRINPVLNVFWNIKENDLLWTRDLEGYYWICRATSKAESYYSKEMDIGAIVPVEAYKFGLEVPGRIKSSFNRPRGGTSEYIKDKAIVEYSKHIYNQLSKSNTYKVQEFQGELLDNIPDYDLEELVISYLQLKENYYVLSNSIASNSTTIKIECELINRNKDELKKAVVQVKGGKSIVIDALDYKKFDDDGYIIYLYAPVIQNKDKLNNCVEITREDLLSFYQEYRNILPESTTRWEYLIIGGN